MADCRRCGGTHYGSSECPYLGPATCFNCGQAIESEAGQDYGFHPKRKFDDRGRVYHAACELQPDKVGPFERLRKKSIEFLCKDDPEANGRVAQPGERRFTLKFPLENGDELIVHMGCEGMNHFETFIAQMMVDDSEGK